MKKIRWKRHLSTLAVFLLVYLAIRSYQLSGYTEGEAPLFSAVGIDNQVVNLSEYRGEPVLVYFWATWCPVCKLQRGTIDDLARDHTVITVASWSENRDEVESYFDTPLARRTTIDDPHGELASLYGISGVPSFFIIDPEGQIRFTERGYTTSLGLRIRLYLANIL